MLDQSPEAEALSKAVNQSVSGGTLMFYEGIRPKSIRGVRRRKPIFKAKIEGEAFDFEFGNIICEAPEDIQKRAKWAAASNMVGEIVIAIDVRRPLVDKK